MVKFKFSGELNINHIRDKLVTACRELYPNDDLILVKDGAHLTYQTFVRITSLKNFAIVSLTKNHVLPVPLTVILLNTFSVVPLKLKCIKTDKFHSQHRMS